MNIECKKSLPGVCFSSEVSNSGGNDVAWLFLEADWKTSLGKFEPFYSELEEMSGKTQTHLYTCDNLERSFVESVREACDMWTVTLKLSTES